jgi:hypothetical protein
MMMLRLLIILTLAIFPVRATWAHTQSYGFLSVTLGATSAQGRLELAVRDVDRIHDLDADRNGEITWGEFRSRESEIMAASLDRISIGAPDAPCRLAGEPAMINSRGGESYIVFPFSGTCPAQSGPVMIGYDLLFASDAQHRGLIAVTTSQGTQTFVVTPAAKSVSVDPGQTGGLGQLLAFVAHGAHHIWIGYDHILFLITLLIGTFAVSGSARPVKENIYDAIKVVTAFTLSHSLTLGLAAFGILSIPTKLTESLIAITIALAALNNIWPLVSRRLWVVAFGFGLVHGLGFANVLAELDLPRESLLAALFAFNLGVELGQLAIVFAALPLIIFVTRQRSVDRLALPAANLAIAAVGALWFADRALGSAILPF